ncbi:MAG TPA: hypothetical protein VLU73_00950 [Methylococcaceae bacterium]|nr:hypothetical protein [Methylococcaceae bacterium]
MPHQSRTGNQRIEPPAAASNTKARHVDNNGRLPVILWDEAERPCCVHNDLAENSNDITNKITNNVQKDKEKQS